MLNRFRHATMMPINVDPPVSLALPVNLTPLALIVAVTLLVGCGGSSVSPDGGDTGGTTGGTTGSTTGSTSGGTTGSTTGGNSGGDSGIVLGPLPNPPQTPAPAADDEPIAESGAFDSVTGFLPVRDPGPRLPEPPPPALTDADFAAGPLPPEITIPTGLDPETNAAPFFINLQNAEVIAGEVLEVLYAPSDPDGGLPGMFPQELPEGSEFRDNFDGTKSLVWQPLQADIGIREFTAVALDPVDQRYRSAHTIRIRITAPDDLSTIPNVAPRLEEFVPHTVRLGDPVVLELKGRDLNGTDPVLEIPQLASLGDSAVFNQHPRFDEIFVLQFTATTPGVFPIDVLLRDADDASLTATETVTIEVLPAEAFVRPGLPLRNLAAARNFSIGFASRQGFYHRPDGQIYADIAAAEFDLVTPENSLKMDLLNPEPGRYQFADVDNLVTWAQQNNLRVHGHPLIWHRQLPDWVNDSANADRQILMREYIDRILRRYAGSITLWDVVNEPIAEEGGLRDSVWFEGMGQDYIEIAFRQARASAPDAELVLNDFDIAWNGPKADTLFSLLDDLQAADTPLDGVGFQMHLFTEFDRFNEVEQIFQRVADLGLDIYVTELDVSFAEGSEIDFDLQASIYQQVLSICLQQDACKALQTWGFTDQYSWRRDFQPLPFDARYQPKPAYTAMQQRLGVQ